MNLRRYLVLVLIVACGSVGDVCLSRGMKNIGQISLSHLAQLIPAVFNPWVALGIFFLLGFFAAYATALSWADLTFVLPATSFGYVVIALLSQFVLGENVSITRWVGILLISAGVGIVARGRALTTRPEREKREAVPALRTAHEGSNG
jgi:drug/metabolite transporter (DMT)-like permease